MAETLTIGDPAVLEPGTAAVRKMFRSAARALMANRPLREVVVATPTPSLSKGEIAALQRVGASLQPWTGDAAHDPLTRTIIDYMALIETSLSTSDVAKLLDVDVSRIRQRIRDRSLMGIEYEGEWRLPRFQFERRKVLPGLAQVLAVIPAGMNPLDVASWFLDPEVDLESGDDISSPRQWLLRGGDPAAVAGLAREL